MHQVHVRRSVLYVPGSRAGALAKARSLSADVIVIDLEDAVAPDAKRLARDQMAAAVAGGGFAARELVVRINALSSDWGPADLDAVAAVGPDAVLVPKIGSPDDVHAVDAALRQAEAPGHLAIWAMIETPQAVITAASIAMAVQAVPRLSCLVLGLNDLASATGARFVAGRASMAPWLAATVLAARAAGLDAIDGVYNAFRDFDGLATECRQARDYGFDGKSLIHPTQIEAANLAFTPSLDEVHHAQSIVAAFDRPEHRGKGVIVVDGQMVELLHLAIARRTLALAQASVAT